MGGRNKDRDEGIYRLYRIHGLTLKELAFLYEVTPSRIYQIIRRHTRWERNNFYRLFSRWEWRD